MASKKGVSLNWLIRTGWKACATANLRLSLRLGVFA